MTENCSLVVLDINYVRYSTRCMEYSFFIAADLFSSYENVHYVGLCNQYLELEILLHL